MQLESQCFNRGTVGLHAGGDVHLIAGALGGQGHGQPMGAEIPILGDQIEQAPGGLQ